MGEIINEDECQRRSVLSEVEGRVYTFDIEYDMLVDALHIGNIIRYANQDSEKNNAICRLMHLGERRFNIIVATKRIYPFQEICFPYGKGFTVDEADVKGKKSEAIRRTAG